MLVLEPKVNENIVIHDTVSGSKVIIKLFRRYNDSLSLGFTATQSVRINRERSPKNGDTKAN